MAGKPYKTGFPGETFTVKDEFGLNSERTVLIWPSVLTASFTASLFCWLAIATDRRRDVFLSNKHITATFNGPR